MRPTRTQILKNPKLRTKLTASLPPRTEEMPKCVLLSSCCFVALRHSEPPKADLATYLVEQRGYSSRHPRRQRSETCRQSSSRLNLSWSLSFAFSLLLLFRILLLLRIIIKRFLLLSISLRIPLSFPLPLPLAFSFALTTSKAVYRRKVAIAFHVEFR